MIPPKPKKTILLIFSACAHAAASFDRIVWPLQSRSAATSSVLGLRFRNRPAQLCGRKRSAQFRLRRFRQPSGRSAPCFLLLEWLAREQSGTATVAFPLRAIFAVLFRCRQDREFPQ